MFFSQNFLCPDCHQGFIEKLPDGPTGSSPFSDRGTESRDDMDADPVVVCSFTPFLLVFSSVQLSKDSFFQVLNRVFDDISSNLEVIMGGGESNARNTDRPSSSSRRDTSSNSLVYYINYFLLVSLWCQSNNLFQF